jgi:hypothetical protein
MPSSLRFCSTLCLVAFTSTAATPTRALAQSSDRWSPFIGAWRGPGKAMGSPAIGTATWERVLGGRYVRLQMSFAIGATDPAFGGHAYYNTTDSSGVWMDSRGARYTIAYRINGDTLDVGWTMGNGMRARSVYVRRLDGRLSERSVTISSSGAETVFLEYDFAALGPGRP